MVFAGQARLGLPTRDIICSRATSTIRSAAYRQYIVDLGKLAGLSDPPEGAPTASLHSRLGFRTPNRPRSVAAIRPPRTTLLTAKEVLDATAFYSYHEHMGSIAALSGAFEKPGLKYDFEIVGVDYTNTMRELPWLLQSLSVIERKALAGMVAVLTTAKSEYEKDDPLLSKLTSERKRSAVIARKANPNRVLLAKRTDTDPIKFKPLKVPDDQPQSP